MTTMRIWRLLAAVTALAVFASSRVRAQGPSDHNASCLAPVLTALRAAPSRADSVKVAGAYEAGVTSGDACAKLAVGYVIGMTATPAEDEWRDRQRASGLLDDALKVYGDEPRIYLAAAMLTYDRQGRTDALRQLDRAYDRRAKSTDPMTPRELALIPYMRGLIHQDFWRDWRSFGRIQANAGGQIQCSKLQASAGTNITSGSDDNTWMIVFNQVCPMQFDSIMTQYFAAASGLKQDELVQIETGMDSAAAIDTTFFEPLQALLSEYVYQADWAKAAPIVGTLRRRFADDYRSWAYAGLVAHEAGRDSIANVYFGQALLRMPDSALAVYDDITPLLKPDQVAWLKQEDPSLRSRDLSAFWNSLDPLYVTVVNERKVEHFARVTAAELIFGSPALREHGWSSFAGTIWIRYGRPRNMRELTMPSGRAVFWNYGDGQDYSFTRGYNYHSNRPTDEALLYANERAQVLPTTYHAETVVDSTEALDHQIVRFRGADGKAQVLIYTAWPAQFADSARAALLLLNPLFQPVAEWRGTKPAGNGLRRVVSDVPRGAYSLTVEVWDGGTRRLGRARDTVTVRPDTGFALSDLLLAATIKPLSDAGPTAAREALDIEPLWGLTLAQGQPLALYWEMYGMKPASDGRAKYGVMVQVEDASRRPMLARMLGAGAHEPASKLEYSGNREIVNGRVPEWLSLSSDLKPGTYRVVVVVTDKESGAIRTVERGLTVK